MIFTHMIDINERIKLTHGQGQKIKGQSQIYIYAKNLVSPFNTNGGLDLDETYVYDGYQ